MDERKEKLIQALKDDEPSLTDENFSTKDEVLFLKSDVYGNMKIFVE